MKDYIFKNRFLFALSLLNFLLIYISSFNKQYEYFIDEFYYIACAARPSFGYVDHPPLAPFLLTLFSFIFGTSIYAIRFLPALAASATVFLTGKLTEQIGGKNYAPVLAATAFMCNPVALAFAGFYSMNAFEPLLFIILLMLVVRMITNSNPKEWILIGLVLGLGIMNKHTFVIGYAMLILALAAGGHFRFFLSRWFWLGSLLAFFIVLPNILWQIANGFPSLEFYNNITYRKNVYTPPVPFIINQIINMSPVAALLWIAGTVYLLFNKQFKQFRFLSLFFIFVFGFMLLSGTSRTDRTLFAYPAVLAGGAIFYERFFSKFRWRIIRLILPALLILFGAFSIPLVLPYFSYQQAEYFVKATGINTEIERGKKPPLPQLLADRIGWKEKADLLYKVYNTFTDDEKKQIIISTDNYGKAGALELYGKEYGIKEVFCGHNTYYLWGKEKLHGSIVLILNDERALGNYQRRFDSVKINAERFIHPYVSSHENNLAVFTCRGPKASLDTLFKLGRYYY